MLIIGGAETGRGDNGGHLENAVANIVEKGGIHSPLVEKYQNAGGAQNQKQVDAEFFAFPEAGNFAAQGVIVQREVDARQEHEQGDDTVDVGAVIRCNRSIAG